MSILSVRFRGLWTFQWIFSIVVRMFCSVLLLREHSLPGHVEFPARHLSVLATGVVRGSTGSHSAFDDHQLRLSELKRSLGAAEDDDTKEASDNDTEQATQAGDNTSEGAPPKPKRGKTEAWFDRERVMASYIRKDLTLGFQIASMRPAVNVTSDKNG